ncbi:MAG: hypothetical protein V3R99_06825 [Thermoguttaceae bacterium]
MPQFLALEWNSDEARLVVASTRGSQVHVEHAFSVALDSRQPGEDAEEADVGGKIAAALAARGLGRIDTLVAVGRTSIELRQLSLPPAPDDELPDMVRFQAMREFNELDDSWLLDFVPTDDPEDGPRSVLAAAVGPQLVDQIRRTCEAANLKAQRLILRPCAAASLLNRSSPDSPSPDSREGKLRLLVDLLSDEADLTVMSGRKVVFLRTTRLGGDPLTESDQAAALLGEIRRTMAAAQNQLAGRRVESIVLCGSGEQHAALALSIENGLSTPTTLFDPFSGLNLSRELRKRLPDHPGRFAPLLGMAAAELEQTPHAIDFLHPRRRPEAVGQQKKYVMIGLAVGLLVAAYFGYRSLDRSWLLDDINKYTADSEKLDEGVDRANAAKKAAAEIEKWTATDVVWLDELRRLSKDFPAADQAMLTQLVLVRGSTKGGTMTLNGLALDATAITDVERRLREDASRGVEGTGSSQDDAIKHYSWRFSSKLTVESEKP